MEKLSNTEAELKNVAYKKGCIFSAWFVGWEQEWDQYFKPLARSLFLTQLQAEHLRWGFILQK